MSSNQSQVDNDYVYALRLQLLDSGCPEEEVNAHINTYVHSHSNQVDSASDNEEEGEINMPMRMETMFNDIIPVHRMRNLFGESHMPVRMMPTNMMSTMIFGNFFENSRSGTNLDNIFNMDTPSSNVTNVITENDSFDEFIPPTDNYNELAVRYIRTRGRRPISRPRMFNITQTNMMHSTVHVFRNNLMNMFTILGNAQQGYNMQNVPLVLKKEEVDKMENDKLSYNDLSEENESFTEEKCTICLENFEDCDDPNEKKFIKLSCGHVFHDECILKWLKKYNHTCPICRKKCGEHYAKTDEN